MICGIASIGLSAAPLSDGDRIGAWTAGSHADPSNSALMMPSNRSHQNTCRECSIPGTMTGCDAAPERDRFVACPQPVVASCAARGGRPCVAANSTAMPATSEARQALAQRQDILRCQPSMLFRQPHDAAVQGLMRMSFLNCTPASSARGKAIALAETATWTSPKQFLVPNRCAPADGSATMGDTRLGQRRRPIVATVSWTAQSLLCQTNP